MIFTPNHGPPGGSFPVVLATLIFICFYFNSYNVILVLLVIKHINSLTSVDGLFNGESHHSIPKSGNAGLTRIE